MQLMTIRARLNSKADEIARELGPDRSYVTVRSMEADGYGNTKGGLQFVASVFAGDNLHTTVSNVLPWKLLTDPEKAGLAISACIESLKASIRLKLLSHE